MPCPCCLGGLRPPDLGPVRLGLWYCDRCDLVLPADVLEDDQLEEGVACPVHGEPSGPELG